MSNPIGENPDESEPVSPKHVFKQEWLASFINDPHVAWLRELAREYIRRTDEYDAHMLAHPEELPRSDGDLSGRLSYHTAINLHAHRVMDEMRHIVLARQASMGEFRQVLREEERLDARQRSGRERLR